MRIDAQSHVEVGVSGNPLDNVGWCLELAEQTDHGGTEVMESYLWEPSASTNPIKVSIQSQTEQRP